jgi:hypothetical protein
MENKPTTTTSEPPFSVYKCLKVSGKTVKFFDDRMPYLSFWDSGTILTIVNVCIPNLVMIRMSD